MCQLDLYIERYPGGEEAEKVWAICQFSPQDRLWQCRNFYERDIRRHVQVMRSSMSSRSSDCSSIRGSSVEAPSTMDSSECSTRTRRRSSKRETRPPFTGLMMNALMGERKRSTRGSDRIRTETITLDDRIPRVYPTTPSPTFRTSYELPHRFPPTPVSPATPLSQNFSGSWEADIVDASPINRGRRGTPVIVDNGRRERRSDSTEVHADRSTVPSRARTPSPNYRDVRQREALVAAEDERRTQRRQRDIRIAELERDVQQEQLRQQRRQERDLRNAEINARPPRPVLEQNSPPARPRNSQAPISTEFEAGQRHRRFENE